MTPHQLQIESLLGDHYVMLKGRFLSLTTEESNERNIIDAVEEDLPQDSVASARIDGMPHAQVAMVSDPTLRVVLQREAIRERHIRPFLMTEDSRMWLEQLKDAMYLAWDIWAWLEGWERQLLRWSYWDHQSRETISKLFYERADDYQGNPVPHSKREVIRALEDVLRKIDSAFYEHWDAVEQVRRRLESERARLR